LRTIRKYFMFGAHFVEESGNNLRYKVSMGPGQRPLSSEVSWEAPEY